jgi:hypothetical protein
MLSGEYAFSYRGQLVVSIVSSLHAQIPYPPLVPMTTVDKLENVLPSISIYTGDTGSRPAHSA